jgi:hypothetical protein
MVEAAGVEPEADITTIGVYANLPNVCRITDILIFGSRSHLNYYKDDFFARCAKLTQNCASLSIDFDNCAL